jgi:hypothetical protein
LHTSTAPPSPGFEQLKRASVPNAGLDAVGSQSGVLVLPHSNYVPASRGKPPVSVAIAQPIRLDLLAPEVGIVRRPGRVFQAAVPEAPVDEHRHVRRRENEICATLDVSEDRTVYAVAKAAPVQDPAQFPLGLRITPAGSRHARADLL